MTRNSHRQFVLTGIYAVDEQDVDVDKSTYRTASSNLDDVARRRLKR